MLGAVARYAAGTDLAAVGDKFPQQGSVLVVDVGDLLLAEKAHLFLRFAYRCLGHRGAPSQEPRLRRGWSFPRGGRGWSLGPACGGAGRFPRGTGAGRFRGRRGLAPFTRGGIVMSAIRTKPSE